VQQLDDAAREGGQVLVIRRSRGVMRDLTWRIKLVRRIAIISYLPIMVVSMVLANEASLTSDATAVRFGWLTIAFVSAALPVEIGLLAYWAWLARLARRQGGAADGADGADPLAHTAPPGAVVWARRSTSGKRVLGTFGRVVFLGMSFLWELACVLVAADVVATGGDWNSSNLAPEIAAIAMGVGAIVFARWTYVWVFRKLPKWLNARLKDQVIGERPERPFDVKGR
jgi:hypothetical protein